MTPPSGGPERVVALVGTGTGVGKTWVAAQLAGAARRRGLRVAARKPVQSFDPGERTDAEVLAAATGERPDEVCPHHRWYARAFAPPMAAASLGLPPFTIGDLLAEIHWSGDGVDLGLVETAGGLRSPVAADGDSLELVTRLAPGSVVLVADAGLGTIAAVRSAMDALTAAMGASRVSVVLNRFDPAEELHRRNAEWLGERDGYAVVTAVADLSAVLGMAAN